MVGGHAAPVFSPAPSPLKGKIQETTLKGSLGGKGPSIHSPLQQGWARLGPHALWNPDQG